MFPTLSDDHRWLIGEEANRWLVRVAAETKQQAILPAYVKTLRRDLGPLRTSLILEQVQLRARARDKFSQADQLFFTPKGYEQATDELIAAYKAQSFPTAETIYDLCCGIGGDAFGFATRGPVHLIDRDPLSLFFAQENLHRLGASATCQTGDVAEIKLSENAAWHIDPDRRVAGARTTRVELGEPGVETLNQLRSKNPRAAIKLAPATNLPDDWKATCESEWIESRGECRQLVAWFADLARSPGQHTATCVERGVQSTPFTGEPNLPLPETHQPNAYLYDPSPALLAAHLLGAWCDEHQLPALSARSLYLTSDALHSNPLMQAFRILDILPLDVTQLRAYLRERHIGRLEIKQRSLGITPESLRPQLHLQGDRAAVLVLSEVGSQKRAIVCERANG